MTRVFFSLPVVGVFINDDAILNREKRNVMGIGKFFGIRYEICAFLTFKLHEKLRKHTRHA